MRNTIINVKKVDKTEKIVSSMKQAKKLLKNMAYKDAKVIEKKIWVKRPTIVFSVVNEWNLQESSHHVSSGNYDNGGTIYFSEITTPKNYKKITVTPQLESGELVYLNISKEDYSDVLIEITENQVGELFELNLSNSNKQEIIVKKAIYLLNQ
jgi:hypothetical protein